MRRLVAPLALVAIAAVLGLFVMGGAPAGATRPSAAAAPAASPSAQVNVAQQVAAGKQLFLQYCSSCHLPDAAGSTKGANLRGVGAATIDLWLSNGWMPLAVPTAEPETKPPALSPAQIAEVIAYVTSLQPGGVPIPSVSVDNADVATGFDLFALNCAGCHTITGAGDALAAGYHAPSLHGLTPTQIAEAIDTGPGNMPIFTKAQFTPQQVDDIVAYVVKDIQHPASPGGNALGGVGPVAEGFIGLFVGVGACVVIAFWVGDRTEEEEEKHHAEEGDMAHV